MGKGSSGPSQSTVTQTNIPDYAKANVQRLFQRAETESQRPYEAYQGPRLADVSQTATQGRDVVRGLVPGIAGLMDNAGTVSGQKFMGDTVGNYMSPYMQNVVDVQKAQAQLDFDRAQSGRDAQAVQAGAFGGSRHGVVDALAQEDLARRMQEIQAQGQQQAYDTGREAFMADRQSQMEGLGLQSMFGDQLSGLGGALQDIGDRERSEQQAYLDLDYQDFLKQQMYPQEQLQFYSDIMRGNIRGNTTSSEQFTAANPYKDLLGAGISALSLNKILGGS